MNWSGLRSAISPPTHAGIGAPQRERRERRGSQRIALGQERHRVAPAVTPSAKVTASLAELGASRAEEGRGEEAIERPVEASEADQLVPVRSLAVEDPQVGVELQDV